LCHASRLWYWRPSYVYHRYPSMSIIGADPPKIQRAQVRRLNTKLPGVGERYAKIFEKEIEQHRLIDKLLRYCDELPKNSWMYPSKHVVRK
jgi:hypothetical protein